tara:strand:+ start:706 stop:1062 length:357 start_codon:yes stop_codon:yes gene_type:complete
MKKINSTLILLLFFVQLTASFLHFDCNMACCQNKVISCCLNETIQKECPTMGGNCKTIVFLPLLSSSVNKVKFENDLSIIEIVSVNSMDEAVFLNVVDSIDIHCLSKPPPAFKFPLLI